MALSQQSSQIDTSKSTILNAPSSPTLSPSCSGIFLDFSGLTSCNQRPDSQCVHLSCRTCCISGGGRSFLGCQHPSHRVYSNPAQAFEPTWWYPERTADRPYLLPITSPLNGNLQQPAGTAPRDIVSTDGWKELQDQLQKDAITRYEAGEGITVFVFMWPEVCEGSTCAPALLSTNLFSTSGRP